MKPALLVISILNLHLISGSTINLRSSRCNSDQFQCNDGSCINYYEKCDGIPQCADKSDETGVLCRDFSCPNFAFRCTYGACVRGDYECNGVKDCADNSDELTLNCPGVKESLSKRGNCDEGFYQCNSGQCILEDLVCNGALDCRDGSDETTEVCSTKYCPPFAFVCSYGACVTGSARCNGVRDCADNSDETLSSCRHAQTTPSPSPRLDGGCRVPDVNKASFTDNDRSLLRPGQIVENGGKIFYNCQGSLPNESRSSICVNGVFISRIKCIEEGCPTLPLMTLSMEPKCFTPEYKEITCPEFMPPTYIARMSCKGGYRKKDPFAAHTISCQKNGTWNLGRFKCESICGEIDDGQPYIAGGHVGNIAEVPWHVAIYKWQNNQQIYLQICGGTIISTRAILTAAHCFWEGSKNLANNPQLFAVYGGKTKRDYYATEPLAQNLIIKNIFINPYFMGYENRYSGDIAVVDLARPITFQYYIKPVCLNFDLKDNEKIIPSGWNGRVAGWGLDENNQFSSDLKIISLPTVDLTTCKSNSTPDFVRFIMANTFCIGTALAENVCQGDSGGGFTIPRTENGTTKYFLRGLISVGGRKDTGCAVNHYTILTDVLYYGNYFYNYTQN